MPRVNIPEYNTFVDFPDDMSPDQIQSEVAKAFPSKAQPSAMDRVKGFFKQSGDKILGQAEGLAHIASQLTTGALGQAAAGYAGLSKLVTTGNLDEATKTIENVAKKVEPATIYHPVTETGKSIEQGIGEAMNLYNAPGRYLGEKAAKINPDLGAAVETAWQAAPIVLPLAVKGIKNLRSDQAALNKPVVKPNFADTGYEPRWQEELPLLKEGAAGRTALEIPPEHISATQVKTTAKSLGPNFAATKVGKNYYLYNKQAFPKPSDLHAKIKSGEFGDILGKGSAVTPEAGEVFRAVEKNPETGEIKILTEPEQVTVKDGKAQNIVEAGMYKANEADGLIQQSADAIKKAALVEDFDSILKQFAEKKGTALPNTKAKHILFTDYDGVLNKTGQGEMGFNPELVANYNKILKSDPEAKIVVTSSWRMDDIPQVESGLIEAGVHAKGRVVGTTGDFGDMRAKEIASWLQTHGKNMGVNKFAVLDDRTDFDYGKFKVNIDPNTGLTDSHVAQVLEMFKPTAESKLAVADTYKAQGNVAAGSMAFNIETGLPKYAGSINLNRLGADYPVSKAILDASDQYKGMIDTARRGKVSVEAAKQLAQESGMDVRKVLSRSRGEAENAEWLFGARDILRKTTVEMRQAMQEAAQLGTDESLVHARAAIAQQAAVLAEVSGASTEAGRSLRMLREVPPDVQGYKSMLNAVGGRELTEEIINKMSSIDPANVESVNRFVLGLHKVTFLDQLYELYINSLVSGPITHIKNTLSNFVGIPLKTAETATATTIAPLFKEKRTFQEVPATTRGMWDGMFAGAKAFLKASVTDIPTDRLLKVQDQYGPKIPGTVGHVVRGPTRFLNAEDLFFKSVFRTGELYRQAVQKAFSEGKKGTELTDRAVELIQNPTKEIEAAAEVERHYRTYNQPLQKYGRHLAALRAAPGGRWIEPFLRIGINLGKFALERSPLNIPRIAKMYVKGELPKSALPDEAAKIVVGTIIGATIMKYALEGKITGGVPKSQSEREAFYRAGKQPYSFKIGDKYVPYGWLEPFGSFGMSADLADLIKVEPGNKKIADYASAIGLSVSRNMVSKTWMQQVSALVEAFEDPSRYGETFLKSFAGSMVPGAVFTGTKMLDPTVRMSNSPTETVQSRLPFLSESLFPRRDLWGREVKRPGNAMERGFSPTPTTKETTDPIDIEMGRLKLTVGLPTKRLRGLELNPAQYDLYQQRSGQIAYHYVQQLLENAPLLSDGMKQVLIPKFIQKAREQVAAEMFGTIPELSEKDLQKRQEKLNKLIGVGP